MGLPRNAIKELAERTLTAIVDGWPEDAEPLPDRQFVSNGIVFWDCEQLAVAPNRIFGIDGDVSSEQWEQQYVGGGFRAVAWDIWLIRCVPDADLVGDQLRVPSEELIEASADVILGDSVTVWETLNAAQGRGELGVENSLAFQDWNSAGPEGGFGGGITRVRMGVL